jgi:hypothetical protein
VSERETDDELTLMELELPTCRTTSFEFIENVVANGARMSESLEGALERRSAGTRSIRI